MAAATRATSTARSVDGGGRLGRQHHAGGEPPGSAVNDPDGEAEVLGVAGTLQHPVADAELLVANAFEAEVGVARRPAPRPGRGLRRTASGRAGPGSSDRRRCPWGRTYRAWTRAHGRAVASFLDVQLGRDAFAQMGDVADHPDHAATLPEGVEGVHHVVQGLGVEGAEALVHEQRVEVGSTDLVGDDVGQAEREGQGDHERLAPGQRGRVARLAGPLVTHQQAEAAAVLPGAPARRCARGRSADRSSATAGRWPPPPPGRAGMQGRSRRAACGAGCRRRTRRRAPPAG